MKRIKTLTIQQVADTIKKLQEYNYTESFIQDIYMNIEIKEVV